MLIHYSRILIIALLGFPVGSHAEGAAPPLTLDNAIKSAIEQNPNLSAERARVEVAAGMKTSSPSLPATKLFAGAMGSNPLRSNGQMENSIGIEQMIPFPTKLTSESKERRLEAEAAETNLQARILELTSSVKASFYNLYGARKKIELQNQKKSIFEDHYKRLRASALSDRIVQAHRVWVQTEINLIENDLIISHEEEKISQGKLNVVMGNTPEQTLPELEEPAISSLPLAQTLPTSHPELRSFELKHHAAEAAVTGAKSLWLPDLSIQFRKARRFDGLMPDYSEASVGITLPFLFFWEPRGQTRAANARAQVASFELEKVRQDLKMELLESRAQAESLGAQLKTYEEKIIPQAEKRMKIAHGLVPSDMPSLTEHRDAMESLVNLRLSEVTLRVRYEMAVAKLESLLPKDTEHKESP